VAKQGSKKPAGATKKVARSTPKPAGKAAKNGKPTTAKTSGRVAAKAAAPAPKRPASRAVITTGVRPSKSGGISDFKPGSSGVMAAVRSNQPTRPQNHAPPLAPVPTDGKPRKNQAGLTSRELEFFRGLLLDKRRELVGDMSQMEREALRSGSGSNLSNLPVHMADMGTDNYEQEFTLGLVEKDRVLLREINNALAKIQDGSYGICEGTGKPISKPRLEAQPWARHSIEYARQMEGPFRR
jgi:RNA polymerase-binding protein DksA